MTANSHLNTALNAEGAAVRLAIAAVLLLLSGCAINYRTRPDRTVQDFHRDKAECAAQAGQAAGHYDPYGTVYRSVFRSCMKGRGWEEA